MDVLPDEIIVYILSFLEASEITISHLVCHRFLEIGRDDNLWRNECFENSNFLENVRQKNRKLAIPPVSNTEPHFSDVQRTFTKDQQGKLYEKSKCNYGWRDNEHKATEKMRATANWDPSYHAEKVDWYTEFIHRTAPISVSWFQQPQTQDSIRKPPLEIRSIGAYYPPDNKDATLVIAPLEDGSVCLWDVSGTTDKKGRIIGRSANDSLYKLGSKKPVTGVTDGVCVDSDRSRAFIAVQNDLIEVDLQTLQSVSRTCYLSPISALSEARGSAPVTVGTNDRLHMYDPRRHNTSSAEHPELERVEVRRGQAAEFPITPEFQTGSYRDIPPQRSPLSILHLPSSGDNITDSSDIYVAGRFPSIINYDRRFPSRPRGIIHSGASLSCLAYIPYPFSGEAAASRRRAEMSTDEVRSARSAAGDTIIACGEYGSKGSLELYGLSPKFDANALPGDSSSGRTQQSAFKNRQTSSGSKLLSVTPHGTRLVFSDGNGNLKWVERDGFTEVRNWNIGSNSVDAAPRGIFGTMGDYFMDSSSGDIVRKILPTRRHGAPPSVNVDDLLLWTGEKIGLLGFSGKPGFSATDFEETARSLEESHYENAERAYGETIRRALEVQADEVRLMRGLGLSHH